MNEKLNVRFLIGSSAVVLLAAGVSFAIRTYQVQRTAGALLVQAARAEERGRPERAALLMGRYPCSAPLTPRCGCNTLRSSTGWPGRRASTARPWRFSRAS